MKQYTHSRTKTLSPTVSAANSDSDQRIAYLENRLVSMQYTVEYQQRQIRRLESALQLLEHAVNRK